MRISQQRREEAYRYWDMPLDIRPIERDYRRGLHLSFKDWKQLKTEWKGEFGQKKIEGFDEDRVRDVMETTLAGKPQEIMLLNGKPYVPTNDDIIDNPDEMKRQVMQQLFDKVIEKQDPNAAFRLAQMMGWIKDKSEIELKIGLTADELTRRNLEAERELREWRWGGVAR